MRNLIMRLTGAACLATMASGCVSTSNGEHYVYTPERGRQYVEGEQTLSTASSDQGRSTGSAQRPFRDMDPRPARSGNPVIRDRSLVARRAAGGGIRWVPRRRD